MLLRQREGPKSDRSEGLVAFGLACPERAHRTGRWKCNSLPLGARGPHCFVRLRLCHSQIKGLGLNVG